MTPVIIPDWRERAARQIHLAFDLKAVAPQDTSIPRLVEIIQEHCPFSPDVAYEEVKAATTDDFTHALNGDEHAQLRNIVLSLASQMAVLVTFREIPHALRVSIKNLAVAAVEFLDGKEEHS